MKIFLAIVVSAIIVFISAFLFNILKIVVGENPSLIGILIQFVPFMIGICLIKYSWAKITYSEEPKENIIDNTQSLAKAVINHSKELVQEVKPTINNYIEKHNKSDILNINEDEIYEQVMIEIEEDNKIKSTWAKALSQSDGDDKKAQSLYIKLRVDTLIQEQKTNIEKEKRILEEQEKIIKLKEEERNNSLSKFDKAKEEYLKDLQKRKEDEEDVTKKTEKKIFTPFDKAKEEYLKDLEKRKSY